MLNDIWNKNTPQRVQQEKRGMFETSVMQHLSSGYNLARWLTRNEQDAQDALQEASLRAWRSFETFVAGRDARAWFLTIVRNTCRSMHRQNRPFEAALPIENEAEAPGDWPDPEAILLKKANLQRVREAIEELPFEYREIIILRELEELSYKEIAKIVEVPLGTVMSRLSRARRELYVRLSTAPGGIGK